MSPALNSNNIARYFGDDKKFPGISELVQIIKHGVPVKCAPSQAEFNAALAYGNHPSIDNHLPQVWDKHCNNVRRNRRML